MKLLILFVLFGLICLGQSATTLDFALFYRGRCNFTSSTDYSCTAKASSEEIRTRISDGNVRVEVRNLPGSLSNLALTGKVDTNKIYYTESGSITFGTHLNQDHEIDFSTIVNGMLAPLQNHQGQGFNGYYNITGGKGVFKGAGGVINNVGILGTQGELEIFLSGLFFY